MTSSVVATILDGSEGYLTTFRCFIGLADHLMEETEFFFFWTDMVVPRCVTMSMNLLGNPYGSASQDV
jgi:hypothetical protein